MEAFEITKSGLNRQPSVGPTPGGKKVPWLLAIVSIILATGVILFVLHLSITYKNLSEETLILLNSNAENLQRDQCDKNYCDSKDCVQMASRILDFMNPQADPCSDFYEFACGGYAKSRSIPYAHDSYSPVMEVRNDILQNIKTVMESPSTENESQTLKKLKQLYRSCSNTEKRKNQTKQSLNYWLSDIHLSLDGHKSEDVLDLEVEGSWRKLATRLEEFQIHTVVTPTFKSLSSTPIETIELDCVMPTFQLDIYLNLNEDESEYLLNMYKRIIYLVLNELEMDEATKKEFVEDVLQMETEIATAIQNSEFSYNAELSVEHKQQMKEIWRIMLGDVVQDVKIISTCKYNLGNIISALNNAPPKRSARYVAWRMLSQLLQYLGGEFRNLHLHFVSKWSVGDYALDIAWKECSDVLRKEFGLAVFKILADAGYIKMEKVQEVKDLFIEAKTYLIRAVRSAEWLDSVASKALLSKIKKMEFNPGYPELIQKPEVLDVIYSDLNLEDEYFYSMMNIRKFKTRHYIHKLWYGDPESPISEISLDDNPVGFSSSYDYVKNVVRIDYGLLRQPVFFYSEDIPKYLKFGEVALIIPEMSHAIDATGIFVDAKGKPWNHAMTSVHIRIYSYGGCLSNLTMQLLDNTSYPEFFRTQSLDDLIADMGSFQFAYSGLNTHLSTWKKSEYTLPGISLTKKQTYFTQVAQRYCNVKRKSFSNLDDGFDINTRLRVNIAVSNMQDFGHVFNCPSNSHLNPKTKCNFFHAR